MGEYKEKILSRGIEIVDASSVTLEEYKEIRLTALKSDPAAFASSYQDTISMPDEKWKSRLEMAKEKKTSWMLFAKEKSSGKLVGMIGGYKETSDQDFAEIWGVFVDPEKRGQGIAAALMEGILEELSTNQTIKTIKLEVNVDQMGAQNLYTRFGFEKTKDPYPHMMGDAAEHQIVAMEKAL